MKKINSIQHRFGNMAAEVQNSSVVFQLNISNKTSFCASISATSPSRFPLAASVRRPRNDKIKKCNN